MRHVESPISVRHVDLSVAPIAVQTNRIVSIDALRGFNMFWIIGGDGAIWALAEMLRGKARRSTASAYFSSPK
jgi:hypothetical protein